MDLYILHAKILKTGTYSNWYLIYQTCAKLLFLQAFNHSLLHIVFFIKIIQVNYLLHIFFSPESWSIKTSYIKLTGGIRTTNHCVQTPHTDHPLQWLTNSPSHGSSEWRPKHCLVKHCVWREAVMSLDSGKMTKLLFYLMSKYTVV